MLLTDQGNSLKRGSRIISLLGIIAEVTSLPKTGEIALCFPMPYKKCLSIQIICECLNLTEIKLFVAGSLLCWLH